ncbi:MAG: imidazole glycerol phosphate synthase subunit HisH [Victivallales bacterium]|nr:imidazole glycerol phosphate synthase subunit HisH [Victivallales bacterium]
MLAIIDYGMGNLRSVSKAFVHIGADPIVTSDRKIIAKADKIVLPGVGNFGDGARQIDRLQIRKPIIEAILSGKDFLGICLGMQLLMESSEEAPGAKGLAVFKGMVSRLPSSENLKIPHIGWNSISITNHRSPLLANVHDHSFFYFVHSYFADPSEREVVSSVSSHGINFPASISCKNIFATQFHPEKSQNSGLQLLKNFLGITNGSRDNL